MDLLARIKGLAYRGDVRFTIKAEMERRRDGLSEDDVLQSILNATFVRSKSATSAQRASRREKVHIILGFTYDGILIYTKGVFRKEDGREIYYLLISAKRNLIE